MDSEVPSIAVLQLDYTSQDREVSGRAFDFSPRSARARWNAGYSDLGQALPQLRAGRIESGRRGLTVYRPDRGTPKGQLIMRLSHESLLPVRPYPPVRAGFGPGAAQRMSAGPA